MSTGASGLYSLSGIPSGLASLAVGGPPGYVLLTTGNDPQSLAIPIGSTVTGTDIGYQPQGAVHGQVFVDTDGDGNHDGGEPAVAAGTNVTVTDSFGGARVVATDGAGNYTVTGVPEEARPRRCLRPGAHSLTTGNDPQSVSVSAGGTTVAGPVGFQGRGSLAGHVFTDVNGNAAQNGGEPTASGLTVTVTDAFAGTHTTVTDAAGNYSLSGVPAGSASVVVSGPVRPHAHDRERPADGDRDHRGHGRARSRGVPAPGGGHRPCFH